MSLRVRPRKDRGGALVISGTLTLSNGAKVRVERRAQVDDPKIAAEEARNLEVRILRDDWYGERPGVRGFAAAVKAYFQAHPEATDDTKKRYTRVLNALGDVPLSSINQGTVDELARRILRPSHAPASVTREVINPIRASIGAAVKRGWCAPVEFTVPREHEGRTLYFMPEQAERVIEAAAPHLRPLLVFLGCTGTRLGEALALRWDDRPAPIDLAGRRLILFADQTKARKQRIVELVPRVIEVISALPHRVGLVFRRPDGRPYSDASRDPMKRAYVAAVRRAGLPPDCTPHVWRHTWATYHYALSKDPLKLMVDGGWSDLKLVVRYGASDASGARGSDQAVLGVGCSKYGNRRPMFRETLGKSLIYNRIFFDETSLRKR